MWEHVYPAQKRVFSNNHPDVPIQIQMGFAAVLDTPHVYTVTGKDDFKG